MQRVFSLKQVAVGTVGAAGSAGEMHYTRACALCNRVASVPPFAGRIFLPRSQSTRANPEHAPDSVKKYKKRYKIVANYSKPKPKPKSKTTITVLDSVEGEKLDSKSFITSSPSSPVFAGPRFGDVGVTIMLPPNSSTKAVDDFKSTATSSLQPLKYGFKTQEKTALSYAAAELMFGGLFRNKFLLDPYSPPKDVKENVKPTETSLSSSLGSLTSSEQTFDSTWRTMETVDLLLENAENPDRIMPETKPQEKDLKTEAEDERRANALNLKRQAQRATYIDLCISSGNINLAKKAALMTLKSAEGRPFRNRVLEPLLSRAVHKGDHQEVLNILSLAQQYKVPLSIPSYVLCFGWLGRHTADENAIKMTRLLVNNMKNEGVDVNDLVIACKNRRVLIQKIAKAINMVDPECAQPFKFQSDYHADVLFRLNNRDEAKAARYQSPAEGIFVQDAAQRLVDEQISAHNSCIFKIRNIACQLSQAEIDNLLAEQKKVEAEWRKTIAIGLQSSMQALKINKVSKKLLLALEVLPIEKYVDIIIQEVNTRIDDSEKQSVGFSYAQQYLGRRVKEFYDLEVLKQCGVLDEAREAYIKYCEWYMNPERFPEGPSNPREVWEKIVDEMGYDDFSPSQLLRKWPAQQYMSIGKFLYSVLLKDVKINENISSPDKPPHMVPALYTLFRKTTKGYQKQLKMHPAVHHIFPTKMQPFLTMNPYELPMVCPPRPWTTQSSGVYPLSSPALQRSPDTLVGELALAKNIESVPVHELYPCFDSLNQLGSIPWKINAPVLDVVTEVFNSGGSKELDIAFPPSAAKSEPPMLKNVSLAERISISKKRALIQQENAAMYSLWCDTLYKLCIAHEFRDRMFWLPHNMDFRGRVYPVCPHLQHMSNDMARSLLVFAKGEKLGPDGLDWLKIHTVNLFGTMSKDSIAARLAYANEILPKILDSAENPLTGDKWWVSSEEPWQTLAACKEIAAAIASGDPENFVSHFPVHQDGSCNGLQHYAALGRDTLGAKSVNLVDTDKPSDVYSCVCDSVEQQREKAALEGNAIAQKLEGFICRKVVKQTVMTTVYGVTAYGAQLQIRGQLKALDFPSDLIPPAALFITKLIFQSLGEMFTSSRNTQDWLTRCAHSIVKSKNMPVKWVTPLGLPVVQPYFRSKATSKKKNTQPENQTPAGPAFEHVPNCQKNKNAFSPNFIHSLDSCHMILTGLYCEQAGIPFVSVHDCYWVHAKNVSAMSKICREQFVSLHSKPILEELSDFLTKTYCLNESSDPSAIAAVEKRRLERLFRAVPPKGDFDLNEVMQSKYFFS